MGIFIPQHKPKVEEKTPWQTIGQIVGMAGGAAAGNPQAGAMAGSTIGGIAEQSQAQGPQMPQAVQGVSSNDTAISRRLLAEQRKMYG